jgi:hypothetical protein
MFVHGWRAFGQGPPWKPPSAAASPCKGTADWKAFCWTLTGCILFAEEAQTTKQLLV